MGWQDAPLVNQPPASSGGKQPAWMNAPLVNAQTDSGATSAPSGGGIFSRTPAADQPASFSQPDDMAPLDPRTATAGDYLVRAHQLAGGLGQIGQAGLDYGRTAANTLGIGDSLLASQKAVWNDITGNAQNPNTIANVVRKEATGQSNANDYLSNLAAAKADTAAASARLGPAGTFAANMTGGGPLGDVAQSLRAAPVLSKLPGWLASRIAGGTVGGVSTAAGEAGRNENLSPLDIGIGTLTGGVVGAPGGGNKLPTSPSAQDYFAQAKDAYKPLPDILYDAAKEVHPQIDPIDAQNAQRDWSGYKWEDAPKTQAEVNTLLKRPQLSADDVHQAQKALGDVQGNPNATANDQNYAGYYKKQLQGVLENGLPQSGVPANLPPGVTPSNYAAYVKSQGDFLTGKARDMERADVWNRVGATPAGKDIGTQAGSWLADQAARNAQSKPGVWASQGSPYNAATTALAKTTGQPTALDWGTKHFILGPLAAIGLGEGVNAATGGGETGQPWWARMGEEAGTGLLYAGGKAAYSSATAAANRAEQQAAEATVRQTIASRTMQNPAGTYNPLSSPSAPSPLRDYVRSIIYGQSAAGKLPGQ